MIKNQIQTKNELINLFSIRIDHKTFIFSSFSSFIKQLEKQIKKLIKTIDIIDSNDEEIQLAQKFELKNNFVYAIMHESKHDNSNINQKYVMTTLFYKYMNDRYLKWSMLWSHRHACKWTLTIAIEQKHVNW